MARRTTPRSTSLLVLATTLLLATPLAAKLYPAKRSYDSHTYYVLELDPTLQGGKSVEEVARGLGAEHVERVGELEDHYLIRAPVGLVERGYSAWSVGESAGGMGMEKRAGEVVERDAVLERYEVLKRESIIEGRLIERRDGDLEPRGAVRAVRSLERQHPRLRVKRDLPTLPPSFDFSLPYDLVSPYVVQSSNQTIARRQAGETPAIIRDATNRFDIEDPMFPKQWHLINGVMEVNSINITGVWEQGVFGKGVNVAIVDDGLDMHSDDLAPNFHAEGSWDYNDNTPLPEPRLSDDQHGTRCAGEIAAVKNDVCGVGVAYKAGIAGIRILSASISDADEASALNYGYQSNDIYSCSWGPPDDGRSMEAPGRLIVKAMLNGVQKGRGGKGSVFVFASGNGGAVDDQCNFDGYTNSLMSITVGAIDRKGLHPFYSEACAANMVVTYSSGSGDNIHTTDVGKNTCTDRHGGTSAAAPIAAGIFALVLEVRPDLTWRDMQHLCVQTAVQINHLDPDWQMTASGRYYNHKYGYGKLDAWAIVNAARSWKVVKPQAWWDSPPSLSGQPVTAAGVSSSVVVTKKDLQGANFEELEHVTVSVFVDHSRRGDIEVELLSPKGMTSVLARPRRFDDATTGLQGWVFMTVKHWDEDPIGTWSLRVRDQVKDEHNGTFISWTMQLWGSSIDPKKATLWQLPSDPSDSPPPEETQAPIIPPTAAATKTLVRPTAHLPEDHASAPGETHVLVPPPTSTDPYGDEGIDVDDSDDPFSDISPYVPGRVSKLLNSSTWVFVALGTIIVSVGASLAFFWMRSRKGARGGIRGGGYDFAPTTDDEDGIGLRMRRSGEERGRTLELYDAFALPEEEEEEGKYDDEAMEGFLDDPSTPLSKGDGRH